MLTNYVPRQHSTITEYFIAFYRENNCGCAFPCDENGNLFPFNNEYAKANYESCMANPQDYPYCWNKLTKETRRVTDNAHGTCVCGEEVYLYDQYYGACECPSCGRWYNLFGQELNPPSTWADGDDW